MTEDTAAYPPPEVMEALRELYDDKGVSIWVKWWQGSSDEARRKGEQSVHAMTDGAFL